MADEGVELSAAAQERVAAAVRSAVERELASGAAAARPGLARAGFSRGWWFSRHYATQNEEQLNQLLGELPSMGDEQYAKFATRLAELKQIARS